MSVSLPTRKRKTALDTQQSNKQRIRPTVSIVKDYVTEMSTDAERRHRSPADKLIQKGRDYYNARQYEQAIKSFQAALWYCPCNRDKLDTLKGLNYDVSSLGDPCTLCTCRNHGGTLTKRTPSNRDLAGELPQWQRGTDFLNISALDLHAYREAVEKPCTCGSSQTKCDRSAHIVALDGCASAYSAGGYPQIAVQYGLRIITTAPERAEGYLRCCKLWRSNLTVLNRLKAAAMCRQGLQNIREDAPAEQVQILQSTLSFLLRFDILAKLPLELKLAVVKYLPFRDCVTLRRVSKNWDRFLRNPIFYKHIRFDVKMTPSFSSLTRALRSCGTQTRTLKVDNCSAFRLDYRKLYYMLEKLAGLEDVELLSPHPGWAWEHTDQQIRSKIVCKPRCRLRRLSMENVVQECPDLAVDLLSKLSATLEELVIVGTLWGSLAPIPYLPALKRLKLVPGPSFYESHPPVRIPPPKRVSIDRVMVNTPMLEQLFVDECLLIKENPPPLRDFDNFDSRSQWYYLEVLIVGPHVKLDKDAGAVAVFPRLTSRLKVLDLLTTDVAVAGDVLCSESSGEFEKEDKPVFNKLEVFRCRATLDPSKYNWCIAPGLAAKTLHTLEVGAEPLPSLPSPLAALEASWNDASSVRTLGLSGFRFDNHMSYRSPYTGRPFLDWLARRFPGADTVSVYPQRFEGAGDVVWELVERSVPGAAAGSELPEGGNRVTTIYQDCLHGVLMDKVRALAKQKGVRIVRTAAPWRAPVFPYP